MRGDVSWVLSLASIPVKKPVRDRVASVSGADYVVSLAVFFLRMSEHAFPRFSYLTCITPLRPTLLRRKAPFWTALPTRHSVYADFFNQRAIDILSQRL